MWSVAREVCVFVHIVWGALAVLGVGICETFQVSGDVIMKVFMINYCYGKV